MRTSKKKEDSETSGLSATRQRFVDISRSVLFIQARFRHVKTVFRDFGPSVFCNRMGDPCDHGDIVFLSDRAAKYIVLSETSSTGLLSKFVEGFWGVSKPEVLISVTGGARDFELSPPLARAFKSGLVEAATSSRGWIVTGGTDTGVMKLVGDACLESHLSVPVIGIAPYGATNGNDKLAGQFRRVVYTNVPSPSKDGAPLNGGHTHFLLVDSGLAGRGAWGTEIKLRSRLENFYVERKGVPRVVLVVNGGPGTMETVLEAARASSPIVVIADSGGAASAISRYCSISRDAGRTHRESMAGLAKDFPAYANDRMADKLLELSQLNDDCGGKLVTLFRLKQGDFSGSAAGCDMSTSLLEAITKLWLSSPADDALSAESSLLRRGTEARSSDGSEPSSSRGHPHSLGNSLGNSRNNSWTSMDQFNPNRMRSRRKRAILLAVRWDRPDILERILQQQQETAGESGWSEAHTAALQFALSLHKPGVIKHLLEASQQTISLKDVNLLDLYGNVDGLGYLASQPALQKVLVSSLTAPPPARASIQGKKARSRPHDTYKDSIAKWLGSTFAVELQRDADLSSEPTYAQLFYWAVLSGDWAMARLFWSRCSDPTRTALVGSHICRRMVAHGVSQAAAVREHATKLEEMAIGIIDAAETPAEAAAVLAHKDGKMSVLDLALKFEMKRFLTNPNCRAIMDKWWSSGDSGGGGGGGGGVSPAAEVGSLRLLMHAVLPFTNPYYIAMAREAVASCLGRRSPNESGPKLHSGLTREASDILNRARATIAGMDSMRIGQAEREHALKDPPLTASPTAGSRKFTTISGAVQAVQVAARFSNSTERSASKEEDAKEAAVMASPTSFSAATPAALAGTKPLGRPLVHTSRSASATPGGPSSERARAIIATQRNLRDRAHDKRSEAKRTQENGFYSVPGVVSILRLASHFAFLALYAHTLSQLDPSGGALGDSPGKGAFGGAEQRPPLSRSEASFLLWAVSITLDDVVNDFDPDLENMEPASGTVAKIGDALLFVAALARAGPGPWSRSRYEVYAALLSVTVIPVTLRLVEYRAALSPEIGVLFIIIKKMSADLLVFAEIFTVVLVGFALAFVGVFQMHPPADAGRRSLGMASSDELLFGASELDDVFGPKSPIMTPFWAVFGAFEVDDLIDVPAMYPFLLWTYVLVSSVVMVNLLVAMFSDTYTRVFSGAEEEFRYQRYQRIFLCKHVFNPIPPPFNMPIHVFATLRLCSGLLSRACSGLLPRSEQATTRDLEIATPEPSLSLRRSSVSQHAWYGTDADGGLDQAPLPAEAKRLQKRFSDGEAAKRRQDDLLTEIRAVVQSGIAEQRRRLEALGDQIRGTQQSHAEDLRRIKNELRGEESGLAGSSDRRSNCSVSSDITPPLPSPKTPATFPAPSPLSERLALPTAAGLTLDLALKASPVNSLSDLGEKSNDRPDSAAASSTANHAAVDTPDAPPLLAGDNSLETRRAKHKRGFSAKLKLAGR